MACTTLTLHLPAAAPADHLALQNIICGLPLWCHIVGPCLKRFLNSVKCAGINQRFMGGFYGPFLFSLHQHTCIGTIDKDVFHRPAVPTTITIIKVPLVMPSVVSN